MNIKKSSKRGQSLVEYPPVISWPSRRPPPDFEVGSEGAPS
jgi:hypothetical protein